MTERLRITGGRVYDPANGRAGEFTDLFVADGRMVAPFSLELPHRVLRANRCIIMPGGVDMHCHIAGSGINRARRLVPEAVASPDGLLASTIDTGRRYAALGYTTAIEAAISATGARQAHFELRDTPNLDKGLLLLLGNHELVLTTLARGETNLVRGLVASLLHRTGAFGIKVVNPGGVQHWHHGGDPRSIRSLDDPLGSTRVTPRAILNNLADAAEALNLPHPVHVHANRLGLPGNIEITLETLRELQGRRHHLTHAQFHAYGERDGQITSAAAKLAEYLNSHAETTCDVGQVMFGPALTITEDSPLEYLMWQLTGERWVSLEVENDGGCGIVPMVYRQDKTVHAWQFAIGLELLLLARDPWRMVLSTDHPNGGSFLAYPRILALLMDANRREHYLANLPTVVREATILRDLRREYTLEEVAIITRAGPARVLGLPHKGHLGVGADADLTIYDDRPDREAMFREPRWVIKAGKVLVEECQFRAEVPGQTLACAVAADADADRHLGPWLRDNASFGIDQLGLAPRQRQEWLDVVERSLR
jgi:formylmethanofuran dehydrogenase subunit A